MANKLPPSTLAFRAQLFTLALAAFVAPTTTAFGAKGVADVGTDYINGADALMVPIGDAGDAVDSTTGLGEVPYGYNIGKYEVTNAQYALFLNAVDPTGENALALYNDGMAGTYGGITYTDGAADGGKYTVKAATAGNGMAWADIPVTYVSFWDAARFCNWLTNGGGTATGANADALAASSAALTETGVYTLGGTVSPKNSDVTRNVDLNGSTLSGIGDLAGKIQTIYAVSSADEWYKAAYYNRDGTYRKYPVLAESLSQDVINYKDNEKYAFDSPYFAEVDYYDEVSQAASAYGTFQQAGNAQEWTDTILYDYRRMRGGSYGVNPDLSASASFFGTPTNEYNYYGFRVVSLAVPEPSTYGLLGGAATLLGAIALRRRPRRD